MLLFDGNGRYRLPVTRNEDGLISEIQRITYFEPRRGLGSVRQSCLSALHHEARTSDTNPKLYGLIQESDHSRKCLEVLDALLHRRPNTDYYFPWWHTVFQISKRGAVDGQYTEQVLVGLQDGNLLLAIR